MKTFLGYRRKCGPPGIRNHVLVVSGELSCNPWALEISARVKDCRAITHKQGTGNCGRDRTTFLRVISGLMLHPNVWGVLLVSSGGEDYDAAELVRQTAAKGARVRLISLKRLRSSRALISKAVEHARQLVRTSRLMKRESFGIDQLRVGLNCAGTDVSSASTSNAACGRAVDRLIENGATVVISEIPEMIGLADSLSHRCRTRQIGRQLRTVIERHRLRLLEAEKNLTRNELCPFNVAGGVKSLRHKSRISITKTGTSPIRQIISYGQIPSTSGLVVMDGPALTDFVMTGLMGAGVHLLINCCGQGPANRLPVMVGADGVSPILPVVKVTGSTGYFRQKENRIDFDAGPAKRSPEHLSSASEKLLKLIGRVASGKSTRTENPGDFCLNLPMRFHQA